MTGSADLIHKLISSRIDRIRTFDIGVISHVSSYDRVNVKIKHLSAGHVREYSNVPVLPQGLGKTRIYTMPETGDTVILAFLQHEPGPQLEMKGTITEINELNRYANPVVISVIDTDDIIPKIIPKTGEMVICHESGSYIKFKEDGKLVIAAPEVNVISPGDPE